MWFYELKVRFYFVVLIILHFLLKIDVFRYCFFYECCYFATYFSLRKQTSILSQQILCMFHTSLTSRKAITTLKGIKLISAAFC